MSFPRSLLPFLALLSEYRIVSGNRTQPRLPFLQNLPEIADSICGTAVVASAFNRIDKRHRQHSKRHRNRHEGSQFFSLDLFRIRSDCSGNRHRQQCGNGTDRRSGPCGTDLDSFCRDGTPSSHTGTGGKRIAIGREGSRRKHGDASAEFGNPCCSGAAARTVSSPGDVGSGRACRCEHDGSGNSPRRRRYSSGGTVGRFGHLRRIDAPRVNDKKIDGVNHARVTGSRLAMQSAPRYCWREILRHFS